MEKFKPVEIKQFLDPEEQNIIYKYLTDINFPWHFMEDATTEVINTPQVSTPSFGNLIYYNKHETNPHFEFFEPMLKEIEEKFGLEIQELLRIRAGFLLNTKYVMSSQPYKYNTPHRDYDQSHYVVCYYVNEADGDTVVFHETDPAEKYYPMHKCTPEKGKALLFNGWHYHSSTCPKVYTKRIVLTFNFVAKKK